MSALVVRTAQIIAAEINNLKDQTRKIMMINSIEIGRRLVEAKEIVGHGEWGKWLETEVEYSKTTANNMMKIFREYGAAQQNLLGDNLKSDIFGSLSYTQAVALLGIPADNREEFIEQHDIEELSTRELDKLIKQTKDLEKGLQDKEKELKAKDESIKTLEEAFNDNVKEKNEIENEVKKLRAELLVKEKQEVTIDPDSIEVNQELEEEIYRLKAEREELERKLKEADAQQNNNSAKFRVLFKNFGQNFKDLQEELEKIKLADEVEYIKLKTAVTNLLNTLIKTVR